MCCMFAVLFFVVLHFCCVAFLLCCMFAVLHFRCVAFLLRCIFAVLQFCFVAFLLCCILAYPYFQGARWVPILFSWVFRNLKSNFGLLPIQKTSLEIPKFQCPPPASFMPWIFAHSLIFQRRIELERGSLHRVRGVILPLKNEGDDIFQCNSISTCRVFPLESVGNLIRPFLISFLMGIWPEITSIKNDFCQF